MSKLISLKLISVQLRFFIMYSAANYVKIYGEYGRNAREAVTVSAQRFPGKNHPDHKVTLSAIARTM